MKFSLSQFLNLIDLRAETWCEAAIAKDSGFAIAADEFCFIYFVLDGAVRIEGMPGTPTQFAAGEVFAVLNAPHEIRTAPGVSALPLAELTGGGFSDAPHEVTVGTGAAAARLLCGRLFVRLTGGRPPRVLSPLFRFRTDGLIRFAAVAESGRGPGASALLTRLANLLFIETFRSHPETLAVHSETNRNDPVSRAMQCIEADPFRDWSVQALANEVGMGRANFAARFASAMGKTPFEAVTEERMKQAAGLLCSSDLKVAEIAAEIGYRSEAAFSRRFTAHFGLSPGAMRRQAKDETAVLMSARRRAARQTEEAAV